MNLISCDNCGVVINKDKIIFPEIHDSDGVVKDCCHWDGDEYVSTIPCPACKEKIYDEPNNL